MAETVDKIYLRTLGSEKAAEIFLRKLSLGTHPPDVQGVVSALEDGDSVRDVAELGFCCEATVRKIRKLWIAGKLAPFCSASSSLPEPETPEWKRIDAALRDQQRIFSTQDIGVNTFASTIAALSAQVYQVCQAWCDKGKMALVIVGRSSMIRFL